MDQPLAKLNGHNKKVRAIKLSKCVKYIVSGSEDCSIIVWDVKSYEQIMILKGHQKEIECIDISKDSNNIVSVSKDKSIRLWNLIKKDNICKINAHVKSIIVVEFINDCIITGSLDKTIKLWDFKLNQMNELEGHRGIKSLFSNDRYLISTGEDRKVKVWDSNQQYSLILERSEEDSIITAGISQEGDMIIIAYQEYFNVLIGNQIQQTLQVGSTILHLLITPDSNNIMLALDDQLINYYQQINNNFQYLFSISTNDDITAIHISNDAKYFIVALEDYSLSLYQNTHIRSQTQLQNQFFDINHQNQDQQSNIQIIKDSSIILQNNSFIFGNYNLIDGNYLFVVGNNNKITGNFNKITGKENYIIGENNEIIGSNNKLEGKNNDVKYGKNNEISIKK